MNLPKISEPQKQEERSINRLKSLIGDARFLVREERVNDYGVDLRLELILDQTHMSNITISVQLKATSSVKLENDHSLTYSRIGVANLNYLLNSPYSIYIVYSESNELFFWDYCLNIKRHYESKNISVQTTTQQTLTYNFTKILNATSIDEIHNELRYRYSDLLNIAEINQLLTKQNSNATDLNISKNPENTKHALEYYLQAVNHASRFSELMQITLYNYDEINSAQTKGIITSRLASGLMKTVGADLSILIGEKDLYMSPDISNHIVYTSGYADLLNILETSTTPTEIVGEITRNGIHFDNADSFVNRINNISRYEYLKNLHVVQKLTCAEYNSLCSLNINSRDGLSFKTVAELANYRFNDNGIEGTEGSYSHRYFILDFSESAIVDYKDCKCSNEIYEVDFDTFYLLLSEIWSAKQDIEDKVEVSKANEYLNHMHGIVSELFSVYNH